MPQNNQKILVVAAHPDDEVLGAGGAICKHVEKGDEVDVLILSDGETSRNSNIDIKGRQLDAKKAAKILKVKNLFLEQLPDNKFDSLPLLDIVKIVEKHLDKIKPQTVYTHQPYDLNIDHQLTFRAVLTACRPQPGFFVKKLLSFEVLSSSEWQIKEKNSIFCPTVYEDISNFIETKIAALKAYQKELKKYPHPRSEEGVKILAQYRGMESGYQFAEAFQLFRELYD